MLLTGTGRAFCSGGDVQDIIGQLFDVPEAELLAFTRMTCDLIENMRRLEKPIVAALNGITCGAGAVMAAAADVRVAADTAKIAFLFTKVGLSGADMGAAWLLPRIVGLGRASELLMLGEFISAARALEIGLYNAVVPAEELAQEGRRWAQKLAAGPGLGLAVTKRMLNAEASLPLAEAMQAEGWVQALCMRTPTTARASTRPWRSARPITVERAGHERGRDAPGRARPARAPASVRPKPPGSKGSARTRPRGARSRALAAAGLLA